MKHLFLTICTGLLIILLAGLFLPKQFSNACFLAEILIVPAVYSRGFAKKMHATTIVFQLLLMESLHLL
jgi:hypothetical protein